MRYVLDTNAVSALMQSDPRLIDRLRKIRRTEVGIPQPAMAEIAYEIERLAASKRKAHHREQLKLVRSEIPRAARINGVTARLKLGKTTLKREGLKIESLNAAIAAQVLAVDAVLVNANLSHMVRGPGLGIEDWASGL